MNVLAVGEIDPDEYTIGRIPFRQIKRTLRKAQKTMTGMHMLMGGKLVRLTVDSVVCDGTEMRTRVTMYGGMNENEQLSFVKNTRRLKLKGVVFKVENAVSRLGELGFYLVLRRSKSPWEEFKDLLKSFRN